MQRLLADSTWILLLRRRRLFRSIDHQPSTEMCFIAIGLLLWDALDINNFYFIFLLFSDFIGILFSFSFE